MHLLVRELALVVVGVACAAGVQRFTPLREDVKMPFLGLIAFVTAIVMAKTAGLL